MQRQNPALQFVLPAIPSLLPRIQALVEAQGGLPGLHLVQGQSHHALAACDVTLIASGTATLEAALFKRPMVIGYHMNWLSWQIMKRQQAAALGGFAQHPERGLCGARVLAGPLHARGPGTGLSGLVVCT